MAANTITITFEPCGSAPAFGYKFFYRPVGNGGAYRETGNFFGSPAVFVDNADPSGTEYEGYMVSDCGGGKYGPQIPWTTDQTSGSGSASGSGPVTCSSCGRFEATGEAPGGANFTWTDCDGVEQSTVIAFNDVFVFCTCDDNPVYSTENVTVVRVGNCPDGAFILRSNDSTGNFISVSGISNSGITYPTSSVFTDDVGDWDSFAGGDITVEIGSTVQGQIVLQINGSTVVSVPYDESGIYLLAGVPAPAVGDSIKIILNPNP